METTTTTTKCICGIPMDKVDPDFHISINPCSCGGEVHCDDSGEWAKCPSCGKVTSMDAEGNIDMFPPNGETERVRDRDAEIINAIQRANE